MSAKDDTAALATKANAMRDLLIRMILASAASFDRRYDVLIEEARKLLGGNIAASAAHHGMTVVTRDRSNV